MPESDQISINENAQRPLVRTSLKGNCSRVKLSCFISISWASFGGDLGERLRGEGSDPAVGGGTVAWACALATAAKTSASPPCVRPPIPMPSDEERGREGAGEVTLTNPEW